MTGPQGLRFWRAKARVNQELARQGRRRDVVSGADVLAAPVVVRLLEADCFEGLDWRAGEALEHLAELARARTRPGLVAGVAVLYGQAFTTSQARIHAEVWEVTP